MADLARITAHLASPEDRQDVFDALELNGFDRAQFGVIGLKGLVEDFGGNRTGLDERSTPNGVREPESAGAFNGTLIGELIYLQLSRHREARLSARLPNKTHHHGP